MKKNKEIRRIPLNLDYRLLLKSLPKTYAADVLFGVMDKYAEDKELEIEDKTAMAYAQVWCNDIDIALKHKNEISETNSINGKKGVKVKAEKRRKREAEQQQQPELFKEEAASEGDDVPLVEAEEVEPYPFEAFWNTFNFKRNKQTAEKAWKKLNNKDRAAAMAAIPNYHAYIEHKRSTGFDQNNLYPATYLKGRRWEDDYSITDTPQNYGNNRSNQSDYEHRKQQQNAVLTDFMAEAAARVQAIEDAKNRVENI